MKTRRPSLKKLPPAAAAMVTAERIERSYVKGSFTTILTPRCEGSAKRVMDEIRRAHELKIEDVPLHELFKEIY